MTITRRMMSAALVAYLALTTLLPTTAFAYVGPGAGLSLLGALWALVAAIAMALFFVLAWPVRKMLRRRAKRRVSGPVAEPDRSATKS